MLGSCIHESDIGASEPGNTLRERALWGCSRDSSSSNDNICIDSDMLLIASFCILEP